MTHDSHFSLLISSPCWHSPIWVCMRRRACLHQSDAGDAEIGCACGAIQRRIIWEALMHGDQGSTCEGHQRHTHVHQHGLPSTTKARPFHCLRDLFQTSEQSPTTVTKIKWSQGTP